MNKISEFFASIGFRVDTKGLDQFTNQMNALEKRVIGLRQHVANLNSALRKTGATKQSLGALGTKQQTANAALNIKKLNDYSVSGASKLSTYTTKVRKLSSALNTLAINADKVKLPEGKLSVRTGGGGGGGGNRPSRPQMVNPFNAIGGMAFLRGLMPIAGASLAAGAIRAGLRTGESVVGSRIAIGAVSGSDEEGKKNVKFITDLSKTLGLDMVKASDNFTKILSASQGTKLEGGVSRDLFQAVSEFGVARRVDPERITLALRSVSQMINKQQIMAEELKSQFGEHLPGAMGLAAKAVGKTVPELFAMVEAGEVMADEFLPKLAKVMGEAAREGGALEAALKTSQAQRGRFFAVLQDRVVEIFLALDPILARIWKTLTEGLRKVDLTPVVFVLQFLVETIEVVVKAFSNLFAAMDWWGKKIPYIGTVMKVALMGLILIALPFGKVIAIVIASIAGLTVAFNIMARLVNAVAERVKAAFGFGEEETEVRKKVKATSDNILLVNKQPEQAVSSVSNNSVKSQNNQKNEIVNNFYGPVNEDTKEELMEAQTDTLNKQLIPLGAV